MLSKEEIEKVKETFVSVSYCIDCIKQYFEKKAEGN